MAESPERSRPFFISAGEATEGPFDLAALRSLADAGRIDSRYQLWNEDTQDWSPYSKLKELIAAAPEAASPLRRGAIRGPKIALAAPDQAPAEPAGSSTAKPFSFGNVLPRATLPEAEAPVGIAPRARPTQGAIGTYSHLPVPDPPAEAPEEERKPEPPPEPAAALRRRNYSPMSAGANAVRPFAAPSRLPEESAPEALAPLPETELVDVGPAPRTSFLPSLARYVAVCVATILILRLLGMLTFGAHQREENQRLTDELAGSKSKLAIAQAGLKKVMADKAEYLERFTAAQAAIRNMRVSLFASTRRELKLGDRTAVDQRLFELDQLEKLVPEDKDEKKIRHELTDAFFSSSPSAAPTPSPEPLPTPRG